MWRPERRSLLLVVCRRVAPTSTTRSLLRSLATCSVGGEDREMAEVNPSTAGSNTATSGQHDERQPPPTAVAAAAELASVDLGPSGRQQTPPVDLRAELRARCAPGAPCLLLRRGPSSLSAPRPLPAGARRPLAQSRRAGAQEDRTTRFASAERNDHSGKVGAALTGCERNEVDETSTLRSAARGRQWSAENASACLGGRKAVAHKNSGSDD